MINGEYNWVEFFKDFSETHESFVKDIATKHPDLTKSQFRIVTMLKAGYQNKYIADQLEMSERAVESQRYRIRQKMGLDENQNLDTFLMGIY